MKLEVTATLLATLAFLTAPAAAQSSAQHRATVERQSAQVMPFDMDRTMHVFDPKPDGGLQTVLVHDGDAKQIALLRAHLRKEVAAFGRGDFGDPALDHDAAMPGLAELRAGARRMRVSYAPRPDGATIRFRTRDPKMVAALHQWFAAQVDEHGTHATMNHSGGDTSIRQPGQASR